MNRRALVSLLIGGVITQSLYGLLRAYTLNHDRAFDIAAYGVDPIPDIAINLLVGVSSLLVGALLLTTRPWSWWTALAVLVIGALDALRLAVAPYGGNAYIGLLVLRVAVIVIAATPLMRTVFAVSNVAAD